MTTLVDVTLPGTQIALGRLFEGLPETSLEVEPIVPLAVDETILLWISNVDPKEAIDTLERHPETEAIRHLARDGEKSLFQLEWTGEAGPVVDALRDSEATVLTAGMDAGTWTFRLRFPDQAHITAFREACADAGLDLTVVRLVDVDQSAPTERLTEPQREALERAWEEGYFEVPRETDLVGLSEMMGVSDTAVSQRLRRGLDTLLEEAFSGDRGAGVAGAATDSLADE